MTAKHPALALIGTLHGRDGGSVSDPISTPLMLEKWLTKAGLLPRGAAALDISHVRRAQELRVAAFNCAFAATIGKKFPAADVELINRLAAMPSFRPQLVGERLATAAKNPRNAALSLLAADAIEILTLHRERLRRCSGCARIFIDETRSGDCLRCSRSGQCV